MYQGPNTKAATSAAADHEKPIMPSISVGLGLRRFDMLKTFAGCDK